MDKSIVRAHLIIAHHIQGIRGLSGLVKTVVLVGSLSDDTYTGHAGSDIDLVHVLHDDVPSQAREVVRRRIIQTEVETGNGIPISKCVYVCSNLFPPYETDFELNAENRDMLELPIEIFRMKDSGRVIFGDDIIGDIPIPAKEDALLFHDLHERWNRQLAQQSPEEYRAYLRTAANPPIPLIVQSVLTGAMVHYYCYTGENCSSKARIFAAIKGSITDYRFTKLLELSHKWRFFPEHVTADEEAFMRREYRAWYEIRHRSPFDFVPRM